MVLADRLLALLDPGADLDILTEDDERAAFLEPYAALLAEAYPRTPLGVLFPFRRVFAVGRKTTA